MAVELSYCVVNTEQRQLLSYCLDAIARERAAVAFETETLVLDNASHDGSAGAARAHPATTHVLALDRRGEKGENATELLRHARGRFCLLLNSDSEFEPGATAALHGALAAADDAAAAGATLVSPDGVQQPSAWRFPGPATALLARVGPAQRFLVQSRGTEVRDVGWAPAAALLVRRDAAAAIGWRDADEMGFCRRLHGAGWRVLYVPEARAVHHERVGATVVAR
jgi:GT2 family glycosyltransferase